MSLEKVIWRIPKPRPEVVDPTHDDPEFSGPQWRNPQLTELNRSGYSMCGKGFPYNPPPGKKDWLRRK